MGRITSSDWRDYTEANGATEEWEFRFYMEGWHAEQDQLALNAKLEALDFDVLRPAADSGDTRVLIPWLAALACVGLDASAPSNLRDADDDPRIFLWDERKAREHASSMTPAVRDRVASALLQVEVYRAEVRAINGDPNDAVTVRRFIAILGLPAASTPELVPESTRERQKPGRKPKESTVGGAPGGLVGVIWPFAVTIQRRERLPSAIDLFNALENTAGIDGSPIGPSLGIHRGRLFVKSEGKSILLKTFQNHWDALKAAAIG